MRTTGGDESIPKFATFDDGFTSNPPVEDGRKQMAENYVASPLKSHSSSKDMKSELPGHENSRTEGWPTLKGIIGRSKSASNLLSRVSLMEADAFNDKQAANLAKMRSHLPPQDQSTFPSFPSEKNFSHINNDLNGNLYHAGGAKKASRVGEKKSAKFVSSEDIDQETIRLKQHYATKKNTFQNFSERMAVSVRTIDLSNRVAFAKADPPGGADVLAYAEDLLRNNSFKRESMNEVLAKISPSPHYVDIFNTWRRVPAIRQLCWSPSVSREADPFYGWSDEEDTMESNNERTTQHNKARNRLERRKQIAYNRRKNQVKRDGRYGQIDVKAYIKETLPPESYPYLSFRKRRLPMRTDVGFDGATIQEITQKEDEVRQETVLEEISPRIVILLVSDLVTTFRPFKNEAIVDSDVLHSLTYSIPGIPFAGKDLASAKQRNKKVWHNLHTGKDMNSTRIKTSTKSSVKPQHDTSKSSITAVDTIKADQFSIFSPPIEATISSSQLWKPRPFFDRPTGLVQLLAVPVNVRFDVGDLEPLVCSLALYSLATSDDKQNEKFCKGKVSEEFTFPAGKWKEATMDNKSQRKKKALFSFNPMDLPPSTDDGVFPSLYLVLQVYQLPRKDALNLYLHNVRRSSFKRFGNRLMDTLSVNRKQSSTVDGFEEDRRSVEHTISSHLEEFGTQFLTPLCFGLIPVFSQSHLQSIAGDVGNLTWPNGESQIMQLFAFPNLPESQQEFVDRLVILKSHLNQSEQQTTEVPNTETSDAVSSPDAIEENDEGFEHVDRAVSARSSVSSSSSKLSKKFSSVGSFKKSKPYADVVCGNEIMYAKAFLFTSLVGSDFSQIMLQQPLLFESESTNMDPRLLVDVTGDGAIMAQPAGEGDVVKRSNLLRLPVCGNPSGYAESSEIREIIYIPLSVEISHYIPIIPQNSRDTTNLLFVYPQSIKYCGSQRLEIDRSHRDVSKGGAFTYCLEVGLVQRNSQSAVLSPLKNVFSHTPWRGPLQHSAYTKISFPSLREGSFDMQKGLPLRDELKIRLPEILDDTFSILLTVHSVTFNGDCDHGGLQVRKVAESLVPLGNSSGKVDSTVTTIISDGVHHVSIGSFQVTFVIRVASNIHLSSPSTANVINSCPKMYETRTFSAAITSVCEQLQHLSDDAVSDNFFAWIYYFLSGCIYLASSDSQIQIKSTTTFQYREVMLEIINSFLRLLNIAKLEQMRGRSNYGKRIDSVLKAFVDDFDDLTINYYLSYADGDKFSIADAVNKWHSGIHNATKTNEMPTEDDFEEKIVLDRDDSHGGEARTSVKYNIYENILLRKHINSIKSSGPFKRTAYGANKFDRMKAEATLHESSLMISQLMDDEDTIFSSGTWQTNGLRSQINPISVKYNIGKPHGSSDDVALRDVADKYAFNQQSSSSIYAPPERRVTANVSSLVDQVTNVAQIFVNPCGSTSLLPSSPTSKASRKIMPNVIMEKAQKRYVDRSRGVYTNANSNKVRLKALICC
jgi:hypothetical protein